MAPPRIVKLSREGVEEPVLLHVSRKGIDDLDLDIIGTEGELVYRGKGKEDVKCCLFLTICHSTEAEDL